MEKLNAPNDAVTSIAPTQSTLLSFTAVFFGSDGMMITPATSERKAMPDSKTKMYCHARLCKRSAWGQSP